MTIRQQTANTMELTPGAKVARRGFTLIETMVAVVLLVGVVLAMGMGTTMMSQKVSDSSGRSRAQALADLQIGRARAWPTYATLGSLSSATYNPVIGNLTPTTAVSLDTSNGRNITRVTVTVSGSTGSGLRAPVVRSIAIAAP